MNLQQWAQIAEVVGSAAVIVSLIYVGVQVRKTTRALPATPSTALTANTVAILAPMTRDPEFTEFLHRAQTSHDALTLPEQLRFHMTMQIAFRHWDNLHYQFRNGTLDREMWEGYDRTMTRWLTNDAWRAWFHDNGESYSESLRALVRERLSASPSRAPVGRR